MKCHYLSYKDNDFANEVLEIMSLTLNKNGYRVLPVVNEAQIKQVVAASLNLDMRAKITHDNLYDTVFNGLSYDKRRLRSQACIIINPKSDILAIVTFIIAPKLWIEQQRYFYLSEHTVSIKKAAFLSNDEEADFYIIPGWTQVIPSYKGNFAISGYKAIMSVTQFLCSNSVSKTWLQIIAQGLCPKDKQKIIIELSKNENLSINESEFPTSLSNFGMNYQGSSSTVKMARLMGLTKIDHIADSLTLGPVYMKYIR